MSQTETAQDTGAQGREIVARIAETRDRIETELAKAIVGQQETVEQIIIALLTGGHCLLTGVPGLGKTLLVKSLARIFSLEFRRIQFTPDLMPADIYGTEIMEQDPASGRAEFHFIKGPVFANVVLADEINRTPPKTQAALLEAMEERQVTAAGKTMPLPQPFFVLATQNPIELEGTYPLPEAQLDRFVLNPVLSYLDLDVEQEMVARTTSPERPQLTAVLNADEILQVQQLVREVPAPQNVVSFAVRLVAATRPAETADADIKRNIKWGAGSRASQYLILAGKARALLHGRYNVAIEDVKALARPIMRHRVITSFHADAEGVTAENLIDRLVDQTPE